MKIYLVRPYVRTSRQQRANENRLATCLLPFSFIPNRFTMNALRFTARAASRSIASKVQKRQMGGAAAPEWTGIDKTIRDVFPEDHQGENPHFRW